MISDVPKLIVSTAQPVNQDMFSSAWASCIYTPAQLGYDTHEADHNWLIPPVVIPGLAADKYVWHLPFLIKAQYAAASEKYSNMCYVRGAEFMRRLCIATAAVRAGVFRFLGTMPVVFDSASARLYVATENYIVQNQLSAAPSGMELAHVRSRATCASLSAMEYAAAAIMASAAPNVLEYSMLLATGTAADLVLAHTLKWMKSELMRSMSVWQIRAVGIDNDEVFEMAIASATIGYPRGYLNACMYAEHFLPTLRMAGRYDRKTREDAALSFQAALENLGESNGNAALVTNPPTAEELAPIEPAAVTEWVTGAEAAESLAEATRDAVHADFAAIFQALPARPSSVGMADVDSQA
jgi:hypothetical protein